MEKKIKNNEEKELTLEEEIEGYSNDKKENSKELKEYTNSLANELLNGNLGKEMDSFLYDLEIKRNKMRMELKKPKGKLKRFFENLFRTI